MTNTSEPPIPISLIAITPEQAKELRKLHSAYDKAGWALCAKRDELFPPGCRVRSKLFGMEAIVREGSLYANQVLTTLGHMSWRNLERIKP